MTPTALPPVLSPGYADGPHNMNEIDTLTSEDLLSIIRSDDWQMRAVLRAGFRRSLYAWNKAAVCLNERPNLMTADTFKERSDWLQWVIVESKRGLCEDPRSFIKSTGTSRGIPSWLAIQRPHDTYDAPSEIERAESFLSSHPHIKGVDGRYVIGSDSKERAASFVDSSLTDWLTNPLMRWCFPELIWANPNAPTYGSMSKMRYSLPGRLNPSLPDEFVRAIGLDSKEQGGRADGIIVDDIVGETSYRSPTELDRRRQWVRTIGNLLENSDYKSPAGGFILVVENRWGLDDVNSMIHDELGDWAIWRRSAFKCVIHRRSNCGRWHSDDRNICTPTHEPLWLARYPTSESLANVERDKGPEVFAAQWMNDPLRASELSDVNFVPFTLEVGEVQNTRGWLAAIGTERVPIALLSPHVISVDVASSTESSAARTALSWIALDKPTRRRFWLDCRADRWSPNVAVDELWSLMIEVRDKIGRWPRILIEKVAAQGYMASALRSRALLDGVRIAEPEMIPPPRGLQKDDRIRRRLGNVLGQNLVLLRAGLQLPRIEVRHFPTGTKDSLDSFSQAESIFSEIYSLTSDSVAAAARKRSRKIRLARSSRTGAPL